MSWETSPSCFLTASVHQSACPPTSPLPEGISIVCIDRPSLSLSQPICFGWTWMAPVGMWPNLEKPSAQNLVNDLLCFVFWKQRTPMLENDFIQILPDGDIHNKLPSVAMVSPWKGWQITIVQVILSSDTEEHLCSWLIQNKLDRILCWYSFQGNKNLFDLTPGPSSAAGRYVSKFAKTRDGSRNTPWDLKLQTPTLIQTRERESTPTAWPACWLWNETFLWHVSVYKIP